MPSKALTTHDDFAHLLWTAQGSAAVAYAVAAAPSDLLRHCSWLRCVTRAAGPPSAWSSPSCFSICWCGASRVECRRSRRSSRSCTTSSRPRRSCRARAPSVRPLWHGRGAWSSRRGRAHTFR
eukprot:5500426-Prymnesium_polylepis.1